VRAKRTIVDNWRATIAYAVLANLARLTLRIQPQAKIPQLLNFWRLCGL
jgi:hypothetical protein